MKILLIDDSSLSRTLLKRALGDAFSYIEATDGMSGLEMYFLEKPDLVILDLTMPGMNGLDVLAQLRQIDPQVRVFIGTADVQEFSRVRAMELGAEGIIQKPFTIESVKKVVQEALDENNGNVD